MISKTFNVFQLTFTKGLILERLCNFPFPILLWTLRGYLSIPATIACPYCLSVVPSSKVRITIAFLPAYRPLRTSTTLPLFIIFTILSGVLYKIRYELLHIFRVIRCIFPRI
ncbi:hypothetical protein V1478_000958 [Vespula squamosa]|uniref:Uncharacterized protein n=1 Tax=Vespula squamosa TaxID=30214 RepID=A0ABD2C6Z8_VESSQ